jgi:hypothetical protein
MSDPKLVEAVLAEEWRSAMIAIVADDVRVGEFSALFPKQDGHKALSHERARQAALGHRALRLLAGGSAIWSSVEDADAVRAIIAELRGGK